MSQQFRMPGAPITYQPVAQTGTSQFDRDLDQKWQNSRNSYVSKHSGSGGLDRMSSDQLDHTLAAQKEKMYQSNYAQQIKKNQIDNYNNFDVDRYVRGESDVARRNMARNVMDSQRTIRGDANASGMLFSGHRQAAEAGVGQQANMDFQKYQQDLVKNAMDQKQQLAMNPLKGMAGASAADLQRQMQVQQMQQGLQGQQGQLAGAGLGLIGTGIGQAYGNQSPKEQLIIPGGSATSPNNR